MLFGPRITGLILHETHAGLMTVWECYSHALEEGLSVLRYKNAVLSHSRVLILRVPFVRWTTAITSNNGTRPRRLSTLRGNQFFHIRPRNSDQQGQFFIGPILFVTGVLALKHESRILRHCWNVFKVFLSSLWALPLLLFSAKKLAWTGETKYYKFFRISSMSENPTLVL